MICDEYKRLSFYTSENKTFEIIETMKKAILFINGEINLPFCQSYIKRYYNDLPIYCADGAFNKIKVSSTICKKLGLIIGDGDSIEQAHKTHVPYQLYYDQNTTDFEKALLWLIDNQFQEVIIFGFGGGEMDHYLGNISSALAYKAQIKMTMIDVYGISYFLTARTHLKKVRGKMISIVPLFELHELTLKGFAFDLDHETLKFSNKIGTRNHAICEEVFIDYKQGEGIIFISHQNYHQFISEK